VVGAVVIAISCYGWFFGTPTILVWQARQLKKEAPVVSVVPRQLQELTIAQSRGQTVYAGGFEFQLPWSEVNEKVDSRLVNYKLFESADVTLAVFAPLPKRVDYRPNDYSPDYNWTKEVLFTTPEQVRFFGPQQEVKSHFSKLLTKSILLPPSAKDGIYSIQTPIYSGFQFGHSAPEQGAIVVDLYSDDGVLEFIFSNKHSRNISQAQINRVIQTARKVQASTSASVARTQPR
jgi:hypothetical protein